MRIPSAISKVPIGGGSIVVSMHAEKAVISELSSSYPLKLLSPYVHGHTALVYLMTYGGGLVGGDEIDLIVKVRFGAKLMLLCQGTTKVFRTQVRSRLASMRVIPNCDGQDNARITKQTMDFEVAADSLLLLLPEPITCFRHASYSQHQKFHLESSASAIILDWITSGRMSMGEEWAFSRYHSVNEIFIDGKRIAKDVVLLDDTELPGVPLRPLAHKLSPYACYAMILLCGPQLVHIIAHVMARYDKITVFKATIPERLIWSLSAIDSSNRGIVIRVAGVTTEIVKEWIADALSGLEMIVGKDAYKRAFP